MTTHAVPLPVGELVAARSWLEIEERDGSYDAEGARHIARRLLVTLEEALRVNEMQDAEVREWQDKALALHEALSQIEQFAGHMSASNQTLDAIFYSAREALGFPPRPVTSEREHASLAEETVPSESQNPCASSPATSELSPSQQEPSS